MENRIEEEWEIVDYSCFKDEEENEKSKLGWVIDTGLNVGKKLVITGVVLSSVPLVLPPLVVISALGVAFSVPFGVVFASYACTQKLMSKLLPSPSPPLSGVVMDFYQTIGAHDDDEVDQEPVVGIEEEEKEQSGNIKDVVEMRIELVDNENEEDDDGNRDEIIRVKEEGLAGDKLDNDFVNSTINVEVCGVNEEEGKKQHSLEQGMDHEKPSFSLVKTADDDDYGAVSPELTSTGNNRELEGANNNNNNNNNGGGEDASFDVQVETDVKVMENEGGEHVKEEKEEDFSQDEMEKVEKIITETKRTEKEKKRQTDSKEIERRGKKKNLVGKRRNGKEKELLNLTNKTSSESKGSNVEGQLVLGENRNAVEEKCTDELNAGVSSENKECTLLKSEDLDNKQNHRLVLNDDIGIIDSSLDNKEKIKDGAVCETAQGESANGGVVEENIEQCTVMVHDDSGVAMNYNALRITADDGDHSLEVAASTDMPELEHDEEISHLKEEKDACGVDGGLQSDEELFRDEKIWGKIDAIRVIVGYKAPKRPSYFEELKALYLFTGIEPPSTSLDPCDFAEFNSELCFLMSVIGLK